MSRKTELKADLERIGYALGGATRQAREATFSTFATTMRELGLGIRTAKQIGKRPLQAFVAQRTEQGNRSAAPRSTFHPAARLSSAARLPFQYPTYAS
jgi:hypothetical protein